MLKHLRIDPDLGIAQLVIVLSKENLERLADQPIAFSPRRDLAPFYLEHNGERLELAAVAITLGGETNEELREGVGLPPLPFALGDRVRIPGDLSGEVRAVFGSESSGWNLSVQLDGGEDLVDVAATAVERVQ